VCEDKFADFGLLYKAALAETDHDRKVLLLRRVGEVLEVWEQRAAGRDRRSDQDLGQTITRDRCERFLQARKEEQDLTRATRVQDIGVRHFFYRGRAAREQRSSSTSL
jgi:hypothetical protein